MSGDESTLVLPDSPASLADELPATKALLTLTLNNTSTIAQVTFNRSWTRGGWKLARTLAFVTFGWQKTGTITLGTVNFAVSATSRTFQCGRYLPYRIVFCRKRED